MGAYALIHECGLQDFYALRDQSYSEISPVKSVRKQHALSDLEAAGVPVETFADGLCRVQLSVDGLHCAACSWLIEKMQRTVPGLKSARVRMSDATLDMVYDPQVTSPVKVAERLQSDYSCASIASRPFPVSTGMEWVGGAQNLQSPLLIRVTAAGDQSRIGRLREMVRQATSQRTPMTQLADRVGGIFVIVVLVLAIGTFAAWSWIAYPAVAAGHTIALLTIACPCALALAAPLVITVALGRAAREQIWIRDGNALERLAKPGILWFDKTGTLTLGDLSVLNWDGTADDLKRAAALESRSEHPVARAIVAFASQQDPTWHPAHYRVDNVLQSYGVGICGTVDGLHYELRGSDNQEQIPRQDNDSSMPICQSIDVFCNGVRHGTMELGDRERPGAVDALKSLSQRGWKIGLLSGDRAIIVEALSDRLKGAGLTLVATKSEQNPEQKMETIMKSRGMYPTTVMVGDGINDAAALSTADVGIAIRGAGEVSLRHAPIFIPGNQIDSIVRLVDSSKSAVRGIHACFAASLLYNTITISLAISGWIHPLIAALFMPLSGITVLTMALLVRTFPSTCSQKYRHGESNAGLGTSRQVEI